MEGMAEMKLAQIVSELQRLPTLTGKQARGYRCSPATFRELSKFVPPHDNPKPFDLFTFSGVTIKPDSLIPDDEFWPDDYFSSLDD